MQLNYKSFGQGPPVIILHGLFGNLDNWQTFAKQLATDFSVYIIDQRNHGRSPHVDEMNYPAAAEDLKLFMESQWMYHAHIIGHSMGGKTAMQFAFDHPDMLDRLVVVDIAPKAYQGGHKTIFEAMLSLDVANLKSRSEAETHLAKSITDIGVRLFLMKNLTRAKSGGFDWKINLPVLHQEYANILAAVAGEAFDGPSLFVRGDQSDYVQESDWPAIQDLFPDARLASIQNSGHWVHAEAPQALLKAVKEFLLD